MPPQVYETSTNHHPKQVLIIDDVPQVRRDLRQLLELTRLVVVVGEACNGAEAIQLASALQPDVLLIDVAMPGAAAMDGYETIAQIKKLCPACRTIVLSAHDYPEVHQKASRAGADGFVPKGASIDILLQSILDSGTRSTGHNPQPGSTSTETS